ncbi:hypothetical protein N3K66_002818 [Trichothecium roseum]|uniref:Uncharacterized protein n=1 Tax=Trichothecium roseum TaxID=47278 RepID=A0ACC0VAM9_9HYPO|nr:hypothetical protein N3K66_002818 [Trichothecium roseum]
MPSDPGIKRGDVEIAIICALPVEARAVRALFENTSSDAVDGGYGYIVTKLQHDENAYTLGKISGHWVVLIHMPSVGKISAAAVTTHLKHNYTGIKLALLSGICGGVPNENDKYPGEFEQSEHSQALIGRPSPEIREFINKLESSKDALEQEIQETMGKNIKPNFQLMDDLYDPNYWHMHREPEDCQGQPKTCERDQQTCGSARSSTCDALQCNVNNLERRDKRTELKPVVHFGPIASGDMVIKCGTHRDALAQKHEIIAFDMEGAGASMHQSCLVVKSISDYADSHKNNTWQEHASLAAAACTKAIIDQWDRPGKSEAEAEAAPEPKRPKRLSKAERRLALRHGHGEQPRGLMPSDIFTKTLTLTEWRPGEIVDRYTESSARPMYYCY